MLVYIHAPFCKSKCSYCAFPSIAVGKDPGKFAPVLKDYYDTLSMEIAQSGDALGKRSVTSVFFGGGTPSLLPPALIEGLLSKLAGAFSLSEKAEITLEANPESLRGKAAAQYLGAGVNRLSLGVQSLDDGLLRVLGRPHKAIDAINAMYAAKAAGFKNVNMDLMWGLPGQGVRRWLQTLKEAIELGPDHISSYNLTLEPGTPLEREYENGSLILPSERDQSLMFMEGAALLESGGYIQYEISNFARMGFQCAHNIGYWEGQEYLGLGPSSTSTIGPRRWTNPASIASWKEQVEKGADGRTVEILTPKIRILEHIMLRLRTARGLRLKAYKDLTGGDFLKDHEKLVQTLHENGLLRIRNGYLSLTRSGMMVSNAVLTNIFERLEADPALNPDKFPRKPPTENKIVAHPAPRALPVKWPEARAITKAGQIIDPS